MNTIFIINHLIIPRACLIPRMCLACVWCCAVWSGFSICEVQWWGHVTLIYLFLTQHTHTLTHTHTHTLYTQHTHTHTHTPISVAREQCGTVGENLMMIRYSSSRGPGPPHTSPSPHPAPPECWASRVTDRPNHVCRNITTQLSGRHDNNLHQYTIFHTATPCL